jgi:zinc/manganese transport system substrate-binding protein
MNQRFISVALVLGLLLGVPALVCAKVQVFACEPEWASLAKMIGGEYVQAYAATNAYQDPHYIRARPSLIAKMRRADLVICSGADLEVGWLPILLQKAGNADVQTGSPNHIKAADLVPVLEKPTKVDRSMGDVHPQGNPHVHLNPHNVLKVARVLNQRLQALDPTHAAAIRKQFANFSDRWRQAVVRWEEQAVILKGKRVVTHHTAWSYLLDWLKIERANTLEPKPGIPPNTGHLETLLQQVKGAPVLAIIRTPYAPDDGSEWLAKKTGIPALVLPYTVGGSDKATDLFGLYEDTLLRLIEVVHAQH